MQDVSPLSDMALGLRKTCTRPSVVLIHVSPYKDWENTAVLIGMKPAIIKFSEFDFSIALQQCLHFETESMYLYRPLCREMKTMIKETATCNFQ